MSELIILDRDGVINVDSKDYIRSPDEWHAIPGSLDAIAKLHKAGYKIGIATNQSGINRGYYSEDTLDKIHAKMLAEIKKAGGHIDMIAYCPHTPDDYCECRKPKPGLLNHISQTLNIPLSHAIMIGDKQTDFDAAKAAGADGILINADTNKKSDFSSLADTVDALLSLKINFQKNRYSLKNSKQELLSKAIGFKPHKAIPSVVDLSAGIGSDAYLLHQLQCPLILLERSRIIYIFLKHALRHAGLDITLYNIDAQDYLQKLKPDYYPDIIYFDPIFPNTNKTALPKKSAQWLRQLAGSDSDAKTVFELALTKAKKRVVVKRPLHAETINTQKPDIVFSGKTIRFDVYLIS